MLRGLAIQLVVSDNCQCWLCHIQAHGNAWQGPSNMRHPVASLLHSPAFAASGEPCSAQLTHALPVCALQHARLSPRRQWDQAWHGPRRCPCHGGMKWQATIEDGSISGGWYCTLNSPGRIASYLDIPEAAVHAEFGVVLSYIQQAACSRQKS